MSRESIQQDDALIDAEDVYVDGDEPSWSIVSVNMNERTVTIECHTTPLRTVPASDLEKMKRPLGRSRRYHSFPKRLRRQRLDGLR
jgi:hypothetical protein